MASARLINNVFVSRRTRRIAWSPVSYLQVVLTPLMLVAATVVGAMAGPLEDVVAAAERGDYATVTWLLRPLAENGNATAQTNLGFMYDNARGVPQDLAEAIKWFRLGALQGDAIAQYNLGAMYANGRGVSADYVQAANWYLLSAEQNYPWAQFYLGFFFTNGYGVPKNLIMAHMWFSLAAVSHFDPPVGSLQPLDENVRRGLIRLATGARTKIESAMNSDQIAEAQRRTREWKPRQRP